MIERFTMSELHDELKAVGKQRNQEKLKKSTETVRYTAKGLALLVEAIALGVTSGYAVFAGWNADLPKWGADTLMIAGAFIAIRAFVEFVKFLNRR